ncbi:MAG: hypothetical protein AAB459_01860 [Patescibacteria group bacterium]
MISIGLASNVTQGFKASVAIPKGAVVSIKSDGANELEKTTTANDKYVVGVAVESNESLVDVRPKDSDISVAVNGEIEILASTLNGDIKSGDLLIASNLAGIAVKDFPPSPGVKYIAVASAELNDSTSGVKKIDVELNDGTKKQTSVGLIKAKILLGSRQQANKDETAIQSFGRKITGKPVSFVQVVISGAVFFTVVILVGIVLYTSIRNSFVSLGRNPLSKSSIIGSLIRVIIIAMVVLGSGVAVTYAILLI